MIHQFSERLKVIAHSPIRVFIASNNRRYWYPYRLSRPGPAENWARNSCLELIVDSDIGDDDVTNDDVIAAAHESNADFVIPADVFRNQSKTTDAVHDFLTLYHDHPCRATPLIPLQPPYAEHYRELPDYSHYVLGGMGSSPPREQLAELRRFREAAGRHVYAHALGMGASVPLIKAFRADPTLINSLDLSTTERLPAVSKIADKTWEHRPFHYPSGKDSSTVRAAFAQALALQLNYMLSPLCDDDVLEGDTEQTTLLRALADGGENERYQI